MNRLDAKMPHVLRIGAIAVAFLAATALPFSASGASRGSIPRQDGKPDFSGIWESSSGADYDLEPHSDRADTPPGVGVVDGDTIPYLPAALDQRKKNFEGRATLDPSLKGWTLGTPRGIYYPEPFQIFQRKGDLTLVFEFGHSVRTIYTNGTPHHGGEAQEYWLGDSRAHWEGDTLVVDVTDFNDETWLDRAGNFHSEALHVIEHWTFLDANTISYRATIEDPNVFSRPWNLEVVLNRHREKNFQLIEDYRYTLAYDGLYPPQHGPDDDHAHPGASNTPDTATANESAKATAAAPQAAVSASPAAAAGGAPRPPGGGAIARETSFPAIASAPWHGPRLADGQPDVQGHWSNTIANHNNFTDPQGGVPGDPNPRNIPTGPREARAPSRVSDPPDGQVPFQPWAREKVADFQAHFHNPTQPQYIEPLARCAPAGVPKSLYWHGYEIRQYPGYVLFLFNSGTRIVHLDGSPHLPDNIKLWNADSRGHWEGNTLVVDVANDNSKALFGRTGEFASDKVHIVERYIFDNSRQRYNYVATFDDPSVYLRPFTVTIPAKRWTAADKPNGWHFETVLANIDGKEPVIERPERICVENNGPFGQVAVTPKKK
jgi:hypothetical protein